MLTLVKILPDGDAFIAVLRSPRGTLYRVQVRQDELLDRGRFARAVNLQTGRKFHERYLDSEEWRGLLWFKFGIQHAVGKEQNVHRT